MFVLASNGRYGTLCFFKIYNFRPVERRLKIRIQNGLTGVADWNAFLSQVTAKMIILGHSKLCLHFWHTRQAHRISLWIQHCGSIKMHLACLLLSTLSLRSELKIWWVSLNLLSDQLIWHWEDSLGQECLLECISWLKGVKLLLVFQIEIEHFSGFLVVCEKKNCTSEDRRKVKLNYNNSQGRPGIWSVSPIK